MKRQCRFCSQFFNAESDDLYFQTICNDCKLSVKEFIKNDKESMKEIICMVKNDNEVLTKLAKCLFEVPAQEIGLGGRGSIADYFR